jgi:hypothetical protein
VEEEKKKREEEEKDEKKKKTNIYCRFPKHNPHVLLL